MANLREKGNRMKHGKKPTVEQRKLLTKEGLNWADWLIVKDMPHSMIAVNRNTEEIKVVEK